MDYFKLLLLYAWISKKTKWIDGNEELQKEPNASVISTVNKHGRSAATMNAIVRSSNAAVLNHQPRTVAFSKLKQSSRTLCCCNRRRVDLMNPKGCFGKGDVALSFSGCGFLGVYHFGVLHELTRDGKALLNRVKRCAGASAGSLAAALWIFLPNDADKGFKDVIKLATEIHALRFGVLSPNFVLHRNLQKIIDSYIPQDISCAQNRLYISVSHQNRNGNRLISQFPSRDYLINCLLASCYIPLYSGASPPVIDGDFYIDGGFTNNMPSFDELPTITVSPFSGNAVIAPNDHDFVNSFREWRLRVGTQELKVNVQNMVRGAQALFPPNVKILKTYYEMGQRDAMKFLLDFGILERQIGVAAYGQGCEVMSTTQVLKKGVFFIFRLISGLISSLCCIIRRKRNIGELPYTVVHNRPQSYQNTSETQWKSWGNVPFVSPEEKIEEYRRKKTGLDVPPEKEPETDFFNDMQPEVVQARKAYIGDGSKEYEAEKKNPFDLKTDEVTLRLGEFDSLEDLSENDEGTMWDAEIDLQGVENVLYEQRAKERQERRLARQMKHAERLQQRKK